MKIFLFMLGIWFAGLADLVEAQESIFYVGQSHNDWAFNVTGRGRAVAGDTLVYVNIDELRITNNPKQGTEKFIKKISVGFGYLEPNGRWNVRNVPGGDWIVNNTLKVGELVVYNDHDAVLRLNNEKKENFWVVITVEMTNGSTVYAHSRRDLF